MHCKFQMYARHTVTKFFYSRREFGLERFVPISLFDGMKRKELRRLIGHFLKLHTENTTSSSTKALTQLQVKKTERFDGR